MAKTSIIYVWTEKAKKPFSKNIEVGKQATFMGRPVTDKNLVASWLKAGWIKAVEETR